MTPAPASTLSLGFSPCPNDCFIFHALLHEKLDLGLRFFPVMEDVETLNQLGSTAKLEITKMSCAAFPDVAGNYQFLETGWALGFKCGPLLVSKRKISRKELEGGKIKVAIPGKKTTANFLLSILFPEISDRVEMLYSEIENAVLDEKADAGLIIHESRFTFRKKGLLRALDLGEEWEERTRLPVPLGGIAVRRNLGSKLKAEIGEAIRKSLRYAFQNPADSKDFIRLNAQVRDSRVIRKHIDLYVNRFSLVLGTLGRASVRELFRRGAEAGLFPEIAGEIFHPGKN